MSNFGQTIKEIYREHKALFGLMIFLAVIALALLIVSVVTLEPSSAVVKVGYGDIGSFTGEDLTEMRIAGGYRDGSWVNMLTFPILALIFGVVHNLIAMKLFKQRGESAARAFVIISAFIAVGAFLVLFRLLGEG